MVANVDKDPEKTERKMPEINQQKKMSKFRFGNGQPIEATKVIHLPIIWKGVRMTIKMNLLKQIVPTLLRMEAMNKMQAKINICDQTMEKNGTTRKIETNDTGHIIWRNVQIDIEKLTQQKNKIEKIFALTDNSEIQKRIRKIHRKFGHASKEKKENLFKNTSVEKNIGVKEIKREISEVLDKCIPCRETDRPKNIRKVNEKARSNKFNNSIAIDLTEWYDKKKENKIIICHIIDEFSRISSAKIVPDKTAETMIGALFEAWLSKYGIPCKILHDLGGEFTNEKW